jgi:molecular chaperone GrpE (heat shock protein)
MSGSFKPYSRMENYPDEILNKSSPILIDEQEAAADGALRGIQDGVSGLRTELEALNKSLSDRKERNAELEAGMAAMYRAIQFCVTIIHSQLAARRKTDEPYNGLLIGEFEKLLAQVISDLGKCNLRIILPVPLKDDFNPKLHRGIGTVHIQGAPPGKVAEVITPGFIYDSKTIYAQVNVTQ